MIQFKCPSCRREIRFEDAVAGQVGGCPCGARFQIPNLTKQNDDDATMTAATLDGTDSFVGALVSGFAAGAVNAICTGFTSQSRSVTPVLITPGDRQQQSTTTSSPKSKTVAGILALLLGVLGIHNFYLGRSGIAVSQLVLSVVGGLVTCGVASILVLLWAFIEAILIFTGSITDGSGRPLGR